MWPRATQARLPALDVGRAVPVAGRVDQPAQAGKDLAGGRAVAGPR